MYWFHILLEEGFKSLKDKNKFPAKWMFSTLPNEYSILEKGVTEERNYDLA